MGVKRIGVVGSGIMGSGIAEVAAKAGFEVVLRSRAQSTADAMVAATRQTLQVMGEHPRLDTAVIQTVGAKHWDGFAIALVR